MLNVTPRWRSFLPRSSLVITIMLFGIQGKKPNEQRVVFDCVCKPHGPFLNNQLLQEPENTTLLIWVILRFRVNRVVVESDIKRMVQELFVSPGDRRTLYYFWWPGGELPKDPKPC